MRAALTRHRPLVAALLAAAAAVFGLVAARPRPHGVQVLVAARDLPGGASLGPGDVTPRTFPVQAVPAGAVRRATGRILSGPVRRGEPFTDARLRPARPFDDHDPATVATPVRLADAAVARLLHPGDLVDVLAARAEGPPFARTVAAAVPVLTVPEPATGSDAGSGAGSATGGGMDAGAESDGDTGEGALLMLRTDREQAAALARAAVDSRLSVTILDD